MANEAKSYHEKQLKIDKNIKPEGKKHKDTPKDIITIPKDAFPKLDDNDYENAMEQLYQDNETKEYTLNLGGYRIKIHKFVLVDFVFINRLLDPGTLERCLKLV